MLKKLSAISCLGLATLGLVTLPAQADNASVQTTTNDAFVRGSNNRVHQKSGQYIRSRNANSDIVARINDSKSSVSINNTRK